MNIKAKKCYSMCLVRGRPCINNLTAFPSHSGESRAVIQLQHLALAPPSIIQDGKTQKLTFPIRDMSQLNDGSHPDQTC